MAARGQSPNCDQSKLPVRSPDPRNSSPKRCRSRLGLTVERQSDPAADVGVVCGPFRSSLRSFCGPACREQLGTDENGRPRTPAFPRLSPVFAAIFKVMNLRPKIGETGSAWLSYAVFDASAVFLRSNFRVYAIQYVCTLR